MPYTSLEYEWVYLLSDLALRAVLAQRSLPTSGTVPELRERLVNYFKQKRDTMSSKDSDNGRDLPPPQNNDTTQQSPHSHQPGEERPGPSNLENTAEESRQNHETVDRGPEVQLPVEPRTPDPERLNVPVIPPENPATDARVNNIPSNHANYRSPNLPQQPNVTTYREPPQPSYPTGMGYQERYTPQGPFRTEYPFPGPPGSNYPWPRPMYRPEYTRPPGPFRNDYSGAPDPYGPEYHNSTRAPNYNPAYPPRQNNFNDARTPSPLAAYEVLRKWNLKFTGARTEDAEAFLTRIQEGRVLINIRDEDILNSIPFFLSGIPLYWYRDQRPAWSTFEEFATAWRERFANSDLRLMLRDEIRMRTQGEHEHISDYLTCMRALLGRLRPAWPEEEQLDYAYHNMLPRYQVLIRREDLHDLTHLEETTRRLEGSFRCASRYKAPPAPENSLLPELAYRPPKEMPRKPRHTAVAVDTTEEIDEVINAALPPTPPSPRRPRTQPRTIMRTAPVQLPTVTTNTPTAPEVSTANAAATSQNVLRPREGPRPPRPQRCYNCHEVGHRFPECKEPRTLFCYRCGYPNVTKATCPRKRAENE